MYLVLLQLFKILFEGFSYVVPAPEADASLSYGLEPALFLRHWKYTHLRHRMNSTTFVGIENPDKLSPKHQIKMAENDFCSYLNTINIK